MKRKKVKVAFLICNDVLVDVFNFFDRRHLAKLEKVCFRFHAIVDKCFNERPFLILELLCYAEGNSEDYFNFSNVLYSEDIENGRPIRSKREVLSLYYSKIIWNNFTAT